MKKTGFIFLSILICGSAALLLPKTKTKPLIGIIVPMEHKALNEIVAGFKQQFEGQDVICKVLNAQGDPNIQKTIINQLIQEKCDLFIPIGTSTSQMTLNYAKNHKIVCLAANPSLLLSQKDTQATLLDDTFSTKDSFFFLHTVFPQVKKISLIYSSSEKVAEEIPSVEEAARLYGIEVQKLMVHSMTELYTISQAISLDTQAIYILKDHLIVSAIPTLAKQAEKRGIFIMTSDEGSISSGGAFALGIKESNIGSQGALMAKAILQGTLPQDIAPQTINGPFFLFMNAISCSKQGVDLPSFIKQVESMNISIEYIEGER
ncbi:MAG: ABC transporter substrate binding protein [Chlamydiota bacterium]